MKNIQKSRKEEKLAELGGHEHVHKVGNRIGLRIGRGRFPGKVISFVEPLDTDGFYTGSLTGFEIKIAVADKNRVFWLSLQLLQGLAKALRMRFWILNFIPGNGDMKRGFRKTMPQRNIQTASALAGDDSQFITILMKRIDHLDKIALGLNVLRMESFVEFIIAFDDGVWMGMRFKLLFDNFIFRRSKHGCDFQFRNIPTIKFLKNGLKRKHDDGVCVGKRTVEIK